MQINRVKQTTNMNNNTLKNNSDRLQNNEVINANNEVNKIAQNPTDNVKDETAKYTEKDVKDAVEILDKVLEKNKSHVELKRHEVFNDLMIKIVDDNSGEVISEVPPKKILDMVAKMCELVGVLVDKKA